jgi:hypothetical protein
VAPLVVLEMAKEQKKVAACRVATVTRAAKERLGVVTVEATATATAARMGAEGCTLV